jgi:hypothetical protein
MDEKSSTWMENFKIMMWRVQIGGEHDHLLNLFMELSNF